MAVWNAPIACNDHALMALRAAVEAQRSIKDLQAEGTHILRMDFGIGINSGLAVAGNMGSIDRIEYSVIGDCVNTAAKITSLTPMGKIWIGEKTLKSAGDNIMVKSLEAFEVKGKKQSVKVYEVLDVL
jgi:adenylate cyclase